MLAPNFIMMRALLIRLLSKISKILRSFLFILLILRHRMSCSRNHRSLSGCPFSFCPSSSLLPYRLLRPLQQFMLGEFTYLKLAD